MDRPTDSQSVTGHVPIDFNDPVQSLRAFVKLMGDLDPTVETPSWFGGTVFGDTRRDRPLKPLMGIEGFGVLRAERQSEYFVALPPESWGSKNDSSFSVYTRENEPLPPLE